MRFAALTALLVSLPVMSPAADWVIGAGFSDFSDSSATDTGVIVGELHSDPFYSLGPVDISYAGSGALHTNGDVFAGAGLSAISEISPDWFIEASVMPGVFFEAEEQNDLGSTFEIRSLLGIGYTLESGSRVSLAVTHKSNAGKSETNPGVNSVILRFRRAF